MFDRSDTILFLDDNHVADHARLQRVWHEPRKFGPVLTPTEPWERHCVIVYGSVLPHPEGGYHMWYQTYSRHVRAPDRAVFCYARSEDGINWEKPVIGDHEWNGSRENNIFYVHPGDTWLSTANVVHDPADPNPARRYKLVSSMRIDGVPGICAMFSPDGMHWSAPDRHLLTSASDRVTLMHDPGGDVPWVIYCRRHGMDAEFRRRVVYRSESRDFETWSEPAPCVVPDLRDSWDVQFYAMPAFSYHDVYIGGLQRLWSTPDRLDVELAVSRDTTNWERSRETFLKNGAEGSWDSAWVGLASSPPIERDDWLWFYHEGREQSHTQAYPFPRGSIGLAMIRKDRFAGLQAGNTEGWVTTNPFRYESGAIGLNVNAKGGAGPTDHYVRTGSARVEVIGENGEPIDGFGYDDSIPTQGDEATWQPEWIGGGLEELAGRTISLRIYLVHAELFAITLTR